MASRISVASAFALAALAACAAPPDLGPAPAAAEYPRLLPLTEVLARAETTPAIAPGAPADLRARAARLRDRAAAMRGSALTEAERSRIREAVARLGGG